MTKHKTSRVVRYIALVSSPLLLAAHARAATPDGMALPASCAVVSAVAAQPATAALSVTDFAVRLPGGHPPASDPPPSMGAATLQVAAQHVTTPREALGRAASASAAALLIGLTGTGYSGCQNLVLQQAAKPIVDGLEQGASYRATWHGLVLRGHAGEVRARTMRLQLEAAEGGGPARPVHVTLSLDGISGKLAPPTLLPSSLSLAVTLPASSLPTLLAATGGGAPEARIPVTVDQLHVVEGTTLLDGDGTATAAPTPLQSEAVLHLKARHFNDLVEQAALQDLVRLHTTLMLTNLMAHRTSEGVAWEVTLKDGLLVVNNVPIPIRGSGP